ncbi:hypothetical protein [Klebsiella variicola]|uniref:hypothetical protein n=1 Tax=Klebsiella variicola TaxID=244366 RepID=UPI000A4C0611|nr:hypothetical protein [Klebsiella variicola]
MTNTEAPALSRRVGNANPRSVSGINPSVNVAVNRGELLPAQRLHRRFGLINNLVA